MKIMSRRAHPRPEERVLADVADSVSERDEPPLARGSTGELSYNPDADYDEGHAEGKKDAKKGYNRASAYWLQQVSGKPLGWEMGYNDGYDKHSKKATK